MIYRAGRVNIVKCLPLIGLLFSELSSKMVSIKPLSSSVMLQLLIFFAIRTKIMKLESCVPDGDILKVRLLLLLKKL